jgi:hypothetical protein
VLAPDPTDKSVGYFQSSASPTFGESRFGSHRRVRVPTLRNDLRVFVEFEGCRLAPEIDTEKDLHLLPQNNSLRLPKKIK